MSFRERVIGNKPYVYVLNKADTADLSQIDKIKSRLDREGYSPSVLTVLRDTSDKNTKTVLSSLTLSILFD
jgi:ribosome biogenesis GTPase A